MRRRLRKSGWKHVSCRTDVPVLLEMLDWLIGETRIGLNDKQEKYMIEKLEALVPGANGRGSDAN